MIYLPDFIRRTDDGYVLDLPDERPIRYSRSELMALLRRTDPLICALHPARLPPGAYQLEHTTMSGFRLTNGRLTDEARTGAAVLVRGLSPVIGWAWNMQPLDVWPAHLRGMTSGIVRMPGEAPATEEEQIAAIEKHHMPEYDGRMWELLPAATKEQVLASAKIHRILNGWATYDDTL